jgi:hypothetical protein
MSFSGQTEKGWGLRGDKDGTLNVNAGELSGATVRAKRLGRGGDPNASWNGSYGQYNLGQAARMRIGYDPDVWAKAEAVNNVAKTWMAVGASPFVVICGAEVGLFSLEFSAASALSDFGSQMYVVNGDITKWNVAGTFGAAVFKNPLGASLPGGLFNVSYESWQKGTMFNNPLELQTWKSIGINTVGNMMGDHIEANVLGGMGELGVKSATKKFFGKLGSQQAGDVPSGYLDNATE